MAVPSIPAGTTQAVQTQAGTYNFVTAWYAFFQQLATGPLGPVSLVGITDGSNAGAGNVGEYLSSIVPTSPGVALTDSTDVLITSLALTAGDWDLWGEVAFGIASGSTWTASQAALWTTTTSTNVPPASYPADGGSGAASFARIKANNAATSASASIILAPMRVNITTTVTFFLSALAVFAPSTLVAGGAIRARRRR